jgi:epoxyqueuosine reductase
MDLEAFIREEALRLGFCAVGFAAAGPSRSYPRYQDWLARGYAAGMDYLARNAAPRADPALLAPFVKSLIVVAARYPARPRSEYWSNYALNRDYHEVLRGKLKELAEAIRGRISSALQFRICVDSAPLPEREWACRASLGWIGKQGSLVHPEFGCCLFLGALLVNLELKPLPEISNQCGACRLCVEACPIGAIQADGLVDARRCISYLTIEHKGAIPAELQPLVGKSLFGCDRCTSVCPRNRKGARKPTPDPTSSNGLRLAGIPKEGNGNEIQLPSLEGTGVGGVGMEDAILNEFRAADKPLPSPQACLALTEAEFARIFAGTAVQRLGLDRLRRNAAIVLENEKSSLDSGAVGHEDQQS